MTDSDKQPILDRESLFNKWTDLLVDYSIPILIFSLFVAVGTAVGMKNLTVESDPEIFFSKDDPYLLAEKKIESTYGKTDNIIFVIKAKDGDLFTPERLTAIESLTEKSWKIPYSSRVDSITNYQYPYADGDDIFIENLVQDAGDYTEEQIGRVRDIAVHDIGTVNRLVSESGNTTVVSITLNVSEDNKPVEIAETIIYARQLKSDFENQNPDLEIQIAGSAPVEQAFAEVTEHDATTLIPLMFIAVLIILALVLKSVSATLCTLLIIVLSVLMGMGFAGWMGLAINNVSISAPTIIMTLAISDSVHIFNTYLENLRINSLIKNINYKQSKKIALKHCLKLNIQPVVLTSVTTAFGFMTMNTAESPPFRELGNISAAGVVGALFLTLFALPGLISLFPFKPNGTQVTVNRIPKKIADVVLARPKAIVATSAVFILIIVSFLPRMVFNDNPVLYFSQDIAIRRASEFLEENLSGMQVIHYDLNSKQADGILEPSFLKATATFVNWLRAQPEVRNVETFTDILERLNQILHGDAKEWRVLPDTKELSAQYFLMYELSVPYGLDIGNQISRDKSSMQISVTLKRSTSSDVIAFEERSKDWLDKNLPELSVPGAGKAVSFAHMGNRNITGMLKGSMVAIMLISASLIITLRSLKYGLLSFIPNVLPAALTLGIWTAIMTEVNVAVSVIFSITLGIVVDDTIHFMVKYLHARRDFGSDVYASIQYAFDSVGSALISTSVTLATGFMIMFASDFAVNSTTGILVALTIFIALLFDLFVLPSMILLVDTRKIFKKTASSSQH